MQSHHHHYKPQPIPILTSHNRYKPHKTHLSLDYFILDEIEFPISSSSKDLKNLKVMKKQRISPGIKSLTLGANIRSSLDIMLIRENFRKVLLSILKEFRNLKSLKITCALFSDFPILRKAFRHSRGLENLEIVFQRISSKADSYCPRDFIKTFSPRLKQLKLRFHAPFWSFHGQDYRSHLKNCRIDKLNNLQSLVLDFPISLFLKEKRNFDGNFNCIDLSPLKNLNKLKSLEIALFPWLLAEQTEIDTRKLYFDPNKLFPNLRKFTWRVIHGKQIEKVGDQIASKLRHLEDFGLGLCGEAQVEAGVRELSICLADLQTDLNSLHFNYNCGQVSKKDAKALISELSSKKLAKLHTLSLEFRRCKGITNGFLGDLAKSFAGLRFLSLTFEASEPHGGYLLSYLKAVFGYEGVSNLGIKNFANILSEKCKELESMSLKFIDYSEISDSGVKNMCQSLNKLKKLRTVWIQFVECHGVTSKGCEKAANLLGTHRQVYVYEWRRSK